MIRLADITDAVTAYHPQADMGLIRRAYVFAAKAHQGQIRLSGEPYLAHPLEVAAILTRMRMDVFTVAAAFLHDTVEDTKTTLADLEEKFGPEVAQIVAGVTKIGAMTFRSKQAAQAENMRKMILAMADDIRVLLVKLADRLHNMRTLGYQKPEKQTRIAQETLDLYAPLAGRLGIHWIKSELEDLCLYYLEPEAYRRISSGLSQRLDHRKAYVDKVTKILADQLAENGIKGRVEGRPKHLYSIYKKMMSQHLALDQLFDIIGFRIIVDEVKACYDALGLVHSLWKFIPGRFKDYLNLPKPNGYQSLHTSVLGPDGVRIEIQIRTEEMHRLAEEGIAAHWRYKEGGGAMDSKEGERFAWLRHLMEWQKELSDPREFLDSVRVELYADEVHVFTPQGEVKVLPKGATPVDFAYAIHSEVGHHCAGAKINGNIVPLKYKLQIGDVVEIITNKNRNPSKDWLGFVVTSKAKQRIRSWIKAEERTRSEAIGRELLDKQLHRSGSSYNSVLKSGLLEEAATAFSLQDAEAVTVAVGYGKLTPLQVIHKIFPPEEVEETKGPSLLERVVKRATGKKAKEGIKVKGLGDILVRYAKCCNPLPGDEVIGFITHGQGVSIHRVECPNVLAADPNRLVEVEWEGDASIGHPIKLQIIAQDQTGTLNAVTTVFSGYAINITEAHIQTGDSSEATMDVTIMVKDRSQLDKIISDLKRISAVRRVVRIGG